MTRIETLLFVYVFASVLYYTWSVYREVVLIGKTKKVYEAEREHFNAERSTFHHNMRQAQEHNASWKRQSEALQAELNSMYRRMN